MVNSERIEHKFGTWSQTIGGQVRSRVIQTIHMEKARSTNGFTVDLQIYGSNEDSVLAKSKQNGKLVEVTWGHNIAGPGETC